jgi:hypothetical protein
VTVDPFEVPGDTLLARGSADPFEQLQLTQAERDQLDLVHAEANSARTLAHVGVVLGAAFLLYAAFVTRRSKEEVSPQPESRVLQALALRNARNFIPAWVYMVTPALETAYTIGVVRGGNVHIPDGMVSQFAQRYAVDMADYFNTTSAQAMTEGFNIYVNRKLPRRLAADKVLDAFGLNSRMVRALVGRVARGKIDSPIELDHDASTRDWIEMMLVQRAHDIGDNEGFNVSQHGQQITWLYLQKTGRLSMQALKVWHTARDERVCPSCGPLDKQAVPVNQPFSTDYGSLWVPSMHPNCRCEVRLRSNLRDEFVVSQEDYALAKAAPRWEEREHPRAGDGRFRNKPSQRPVAERVAERETELERLLREVQERPAPPEPPDLRGGISLEGPAEGQISLGRAPREAPSLGRTDINLTPVDLSQQASLAREGVSLATPAIDLTAPTVTLGTVSLESPEIDLRQAGQLAIDLAMDRLAIDLGRRERPATAAPPGIIDLPETLYYLDTAGFHHHPANSDHIWYDDDENEYAHFEPEHEFTTHENVLEQIRVLYNEEIEAETNSIMVSGRNFVGPKAAPLRLDRAYVKASIEAEITNAQDAPELRAYAAAMGVSWRDPRWHVRVYRMDRAYANGFVGEQSAHGATEFYQAPGDYFAEDELMATEEWGSLPVTTVDVEPETEEGQYDEFRDKNRDDWQYG